MDNFDEEEISNEEETPEVPEEQINNAQEDLAQEFETELDTVGKQAKLIARKKTIDLLLKKYKIVFLVVAGIAVAAALIILAVVVGSGVPEYEYVEASCSQVTVTYDPYGPEDESTTTMDLEEYVKRAVYAYTTDLEDTDVNFHLYVSLSIALRTEALSNNCQVTYRDKDLQASYTENLNIEDALEYSSGLVIVDQEDNFISSHVSDFCWQEIQEDRYNLFQNNLAVPISFTDQYLDNEIYRECPCNNPTGDPFDDEGGDYDVCWITWDTDDDGEDDESEWLHQDDISGYSVYGALYLLRIHGYTYRGMLEYFFGEDIYIKTTNETNREQTEIPDQSTNCSSFSITNTTLSESEFVNRLESYNYRSSDSSNQAAWTLFVENASKIYNMGVNNNVNPELIVVRAMVEGFSPGIGKHNYFGINCTNGHPENCSIYSSFDEGIMGFIKVIQRYSSFTDLMQRYAYLGDYWFNPGDSANGGCYYAEYIYPEGLDDYVAAACSDAYRGCRGSSCMPTRQQDHDAYANFQGKNMLDTRYDVFGISSDSCSNNTLNYGNCSLYDQGDSRWSNFNLGFGSTTIGSHGCAVTSLAIALSCTGQVPDINNFSPAVLNEALKANNGFDGDLVYWNNSALREFVPTFTMSGDYSISINASPEEKIEILKTVFEESNRIGIIHIKNSEHYSHYVVLESINEENNTVNTLDPAGGKTQIYSINDIDGLRYYTY